MQLEGMNKSFYVEHAAANCANNGGTFGVCVVA
jgi:hypothetical protein